MVHSINSTCANHAGQQLRQNRKHLQVKWPLIDPMEMTCPHPRVRMRLVIAVVMSINPITLVSTIPRMSSVSVVSTAFTPVRTASHYKYGLRRREPRYTIIGGKQNAVHSAHRKYFLKALFYPYPKPILHCSQECQYLAIRQATLLE